MRWDLVCTYVAISIFAVIWSTITLHTFDMNSWGYWVMLLGGACLFGYTLEQWPGCKRR
jgi:hypothetical protein